jgi:hypothetical protein
VDTHCSSCLLCSTCTTENVIHYVISIIHSKDLIRIIVSIHWLTMQEYCLLSVMAIAHASTTDHRKVDLRWRLHPKTNRTHVLLLKWSLKSHVTSKREYHNDKKAIKNFRNCAVKMLCRFFANFCHEIGCENDQIYIFCFVKYLSTFFSAFHIN